MQATPIPPYSNVFYQLVSGCTQRLFFFFLEGTTFIRPSLAYLPSYLAGVIFFLCTNLPTYMPTYFSNLSPLFPELPFLLLTCLLTQVLSYIPTYLPMHSPFYLCFLHSQIPN
jgi:hypothetical protein